MTLMEWDPTMSVGFEEIDKQHRKLIDIINEAHAALQNQDDEALITLVDKMKGYAQEHFSFEEKIMQQYGFPDIEAHKFQHARYNSDVAEFQKKQFEKTNLPQILVYLSQWLMKHIMEEDKKLMPYILSDADDIPTPPK